MRIRNIFLDSTAQGCKLSQAADRFGVSCEPIKLLPHMTRFLDAIGPCNRHSRSNEGVQKGQLVAHCSESVVLDERQGSRARQFRLVAKKYSFPGNEHVVEHSESLNHLVCSRDRSC